MGTVFAGDSNGDLWTFTLTNIMEGTLLGNMDTLAWTQCGYTATSGTPTKAESIAVDINGAPYIVDSKGKLWYGNSSGDAFAELTLPSAGTANAVAVGLDGSVWLS